MLKKLITQQESKITREQYFEICRVMGETPNPDDIPIEESDLGDEGRLAYKLYRYLPDNWSMTGHYMGKDLSSFKVLLDVFEVEGTALTQVLILMIKIIDAEMSEIISAKIKTESEASKAESRAAPRKRGR